MSRVAKQIISIPSGVVCTIEDDKIVCKGAKASNKVHFPAGFSLEIKEGKCKVNRDSQEVSSALWGSLVANLKNAVAGVSNVFEQDINFVGVGYKAIKQGNDLEIHLGYSHPIIFKVPAGVEIELKKHNEMTLRSHDKQLLGETCSHMEKLRRAEPYKGKGVIKVGKFYIRKEGKKK